MRRSFRSGLAMALAGIFLSAAHGGEVTNSRNSDAHPVDVDGLPTGIEYGNTGSLGFISGSLYQSGLNDPLLNSAATGVISLDRAIPQVNQRDLYMVLAFARRTFLGFGDGHFIANLSFPIWIGNVEFPNFKLMLRGGPSGNVKLFADYNGDNVPDGLADGLGFKAGISLAQVPNVPLANVLVVELKIPLLLPPGFGPSFHSLGQNGVYKPGTTLWKCQSAANIGLGDQSEMFVTVFPDGKTRLNSDHVPMRFEMDFDPSSAANVMNFQYRYHNVGIITNHTINAQDVNWPTLRLGDENLPGRFLPVSSQVVDLNNDNVLDRVVRFDIATPNNAVNRNTTRILMRGFMLNGDPVAGRDTIRVLK